VSIILFTLSNLKEDLSQVQLSNKKILTLAFHDQENVQMSDQEN